MGCGKVEDAWREMQSGWHAVCGLPGVIYACDLKHELLSNSPFLPGWQSLVAGLIPLLV